MIEGQNAACGGALISKIADAPWPEGSFPEVSGLWQRELFYITAPRTAKWVAAPTFRLGPPPQLMSWISRGLSWGPAKDVPILQSHIRDLFKGDFSLVMVVQVMLVRRVQPCKRRPLRMWEFNPEGPRTIQNFLGLTHEELYKSFFGPQAECPDTNEDMGLSSNRTATQVSDPLVEHTVFHLS